MVRDPGRRHGRDATSKKYKSQGCSTGSACEQPPGTTLATLCYHRIPCHFDCQDLPCKDGCGADRREATLAERNAGEAYEAEVQTNPGGADRNERGRGGALPQDVPDNRRRRVAVAEAEAVAAAAVRLERQCGILELARRAMFTWFQVVVPVLCAGVFWGDGISEPCVNLCRKLLLGSLAMVFRCGARGIGISSRCPDGLGSPAKPDSVPCLDWRDTAATKGRDRLWSKSGFCWWLVAVHSLCCRSRGHSQITHFMLGG